MSTRAEVLRDLRAALASYRTMERGAHAPHIATLSVSQVSRDGRISVTLVGHYDEDGGVSPTRVVVSAPLEEVAYYARNVRSRLEYLEGRGR